MNRIAPDVICVDLKERGKTERMAGYLITAPRLAIVETGATQSASIWLEALEQLAVPFDEIAYIIVTHIHLDHAGGAGTLARHLPKARVVVHPEGARHLVDPTRLIRGARAVFGPRLEALWGLPEPVPAPRIDAPEENRWVDLGDGHRLRLLPAYGHARHQYMILDEGTGTLFAGDELGVRYPQLPVRPDYVLPSTAPNQFDPESMIRSAEQLRFLRPECILPSHFGRLQLGIEALVERMREQVPVFAAVGAGDAVPPRVEDVRRRLAEHVRADLERHGVAWDPSTEEVLAFDLEVCAHGIAGYHARRLREAGGGGASPFSS